MILRRSPVCCPSSLVWKLTASPWDTSFEDLGADSLDIVELTMAVEEEFGLENMDEDDLSGVATVADLVRYLKSKLED